MFAVEGTGSVGSLESVSMPVIMNEIGFASWDDRTWEAVRLLNVNSRLHCEHAQWLNAPALNSFKCPQVGIDLSEVEHMLCWFFSFWQILCSGKNILGTLRRILPFVINNRWPRFGIKVVHRPLTISLEIIFSSIILIIKMMMTTTTMMIIIITLLLIYYMYHMGLKKVALIER